MERGWLEDVRRADEARKKRWITGMSALTLALVAFVWLRYFNTLVNPADSANTGADSSFSFWQTTKGGAAMVSESLKGSLDEIRKSLTGSKSYSISPSSQ